MEKRLTLDVDLVSRGRPELVTPDYPTDLPLLKLVQNQVNCEIHVEPTVYILDWVAHVSQKINLYPVYTNAFGKLGFQQWMRLTDPGLVKATCGQLDKLTMLSYNVWFDSFFHVERYLMILHMIRQSNADFICLQEVIQEFRQMLYNDPYIQQHYFISESTMFTFYGLIILTKWPCKFYELNYGENSGMGRSLLIGETIINGQPILVSTSHLESLGTAPFRKAQMDEGFPILKAVDNSFMMGDFNFDSSWKHEQACIDPEFDDAYLTLNGGVETYTMPKVPDFPAWRPDKILVRKSSKWKATSIDVIGKNSIPSFKLENPLEITRDGKVRTPSDHFGLFGVFQFNA